MLRDVATRGNVNTMIDVSGGTLRIENSDMVMAATVDSRAIVRASGGATVVVTDSNLVAGLGTGILHAAGDLEIRDSTLSAGNRAIKTTASPAGAVMIDIVGSRITSTGTSSNIDSIAQTITITDSILDGSSTVAVSGFNAGVVTVRNSTIPTGEVIGSNPTCVGVATASAWLDATCP